MWSWILKQNILLKKVWWTASSFCIGCQLKDQTSFYTRTYHTLTVEALGEKPNLHQCPSTFEIEGLENHKCLELASWKHHCCAHANWHYFLSVSPFSQSAFKDALKATLSKIWNCCVIQRHVCIVQIWTCTFEMTIRGNDFSSVEIRVFLRIPGSSSPFFTTCRIFSNRNKS